jgi:hypothetical protein
MAAQPTSMATATAAQQQAVQVAQQSALANAVQAISTQQQFIIESFRGQIYISNELDVQDTPIYDTDTYTAGQTINTQNSQFFSNVESGAGKTYAQTNLSENRRLAAPEAFSVFGVRLGWSENVLFADLLSFVNGWAYEFWLGQKNYQRANVRHFSSGWGISGYSTNTATQWLTNGQANRGSMNMVMVKLVIANQMSFFAQLTGGPSNGAQALTASGSGGTGMILLNEMVGLYARGVQ